MRIAIAEDESAYSNHLQSHLKRFAQGSGQPMEIECFTSGAQLVEHYRGTWDLLLFDVDMSGINGLEAALRILRRNEDRYLMLPQDGGVVRLPLSRLYPGCTMVEAFSHQLHYHTAEGELEGFFRRHKGYLVNLRYIDEVRGDTLVAAGQELPVARSRRKALMEALLKHMKGVRS